MNRAITIVWWTGLIGAVIATLVVLKQVSLVLRALDDILQLAQRTRTAAEGIADNVTSVSRLPAIGEPARALRTATGGIAAGAASVERRLDAAAEGISSPGGS